MLAATCSFGTFLKEAQRDRLIAGLRSDTIRCRQLALPDDEVTWDRVRKVATAMEAAQKDTQDMLSDNAGASNAELHWQGSQVKPTATSKLELDDHAEELLTVNTHMGLFRYRRLPYGVTSAPTMFQAVMDQVLQGILAQPLDDILIAGKTLTECYSQTKEVLNALSLSMADIVITITSTGWLAYKGFCNAVPPNSIKIDDQVPTVLEFHWFTVAARAISSKSPTSLKDSVFEPCLSVKKTGRKALCKNIDFTGGPDNYLDDPVYAYGVFSNGSKVLTLSEYNDSLATKFLKAVTDFGHLRKDTAWLLYNVHNEGPNNDCPEPPFNILKHFSAALNAAEVRAYP
ncbi:hypothetical protein MTO96_005078 [Rhipicephalus appendiculatus]